MSIFKVFTKNYFTDLVCKLAATLILALFPYFQCHAENSLVNVNNIKIEAYSSNATNAKNKAIERGALEALRIALLELDNRSSSITDIITTEEASALMLGYEIQNEKFSSMNYKAILNASFEVNSLLKLLERYNIKTIPSLQPPIVNNGVVRKYRITLYYNNFAEYVKKLENLGEFTENIDLKNIGFDRAELEILYQGEVESLIVQAKEKNIDISY